MHVVVRSPKLKRMLSPQEDAESQEAKKAKPNWVLVCGTREDKRVVQVKVLEKDAKSVCYQTAAGLKDKVSLTELFPDVASVKKIIGQEKEKVKSANQWQKQDFISLNVSVTLLAATLGVLRTEPKSLVSDTFNVESLKNFTKDPKDNYFFSEQPIPFETMIEILQGHLIEMDEMLCSQVRNLAFMYGLETVRQRLQESTPPYFCKNLL